MLRTLLLSAAAAGAIALSVPAPASAGFNGLTTPLVDSGPIQVQRNCYHRQWSSRWRCRRHRSWDSFFWWD